MTPTEKRVAAVGSLNAASENLRTARARLELAHARDAAAEAERQTLRLSYLAIRRELFPSEDEQQDYWDQADLPRPELTPARRVELVAMANVTLEALDANKPERQRASSELGTAGGEVARLEREYAQSAAALAAMLPEAATL